MNHYKQTNGVFHAQLPEFHWLSPISKVPLTAENASEYGYEPAENYPHEYGVWLIESGVFLAHVNKTYDQLCKDRIAKYTESERLTWPDQRADAFAYLDDPSVETKTLDAICLHRKFYTVEAKRALAERIVANVERLRNLGVHGLAMVQACEDKLNALDKETVTHTDVLALMPNFESLLGNQP